MNEEQMEAELQSIIEDLVGESKIEALISLRERLNEQVKILNNGIIEIGRHLTCLN